MGTSIRTIDMAVTSLNNVTDVTITSAAQYDHLEYNGSAWVNTNDIALADTTAASTGVVFKGSTAFMHNFHHPTGDSATPDGRNIFLGEGAGNFTMGATATATTNSSYNIGIGYNTLDALTTGKANVAVGDQTGTALTTGQNNMLLGESSGLSMTTGSFNCGVGRAALGFCTTTDNNVAIGNTAGRYVTGSGQNDTPANSIYIGAETKAAADGQTNQIVIGYNVTGNGSNTATYGNSDMAAHHFTGNMVIEDTTASDQGAIIKGSARFLHNFHHPTGDSAVPVGRNLFIGELAGNFSVGSTATSTSHGSYNTGVGRQALEDLTIGIANTGVGHRSLSAATSGDYNTAIGNSAGEPLTTGRFNTYIGASAIASAVDVENEMVIGYNVTGNGSNTITIGGTNHTKTYIFGQLYLEAETAAADSTTPTLISLPTGGTAAQAGWLKVDIAGTESYIPFWQ